MLKKITILFLLIALCACKPVLKTENTNSTFNILSINQSASLALLCFANDNKYSINITDDIDNISDAFDKTNEDIIIAPINLGITKCLSDDKYKMLAILSYSHYYICSTNEKFNRGDVGVYGKGLVLEGVLNALSPALTRYNFIYYDDIQSLKDDLKANIIDAAILNEIDFNDLNNYEDLNLTKIISIDEIYQNEYGYSEFPSFGLFINNNVLNDRQNEIYDFIRAMRSSIETYMKDKNTFNKILEDADLTKLGYNNPSLISESYNYCGICFKYAIDEYDSLKTLLSCLNIDLNEKILVQ